MATQPLSWETVYAQRDTIKKLETDLTELRKQLAESKMRYNGAKQVSEGWYKQLQESQEECKALKEQIKEQNENENMPTDQIPPYERNRDHRNPTKNNDQNPDDRNPLDV
jgi:chromosome segregation ATPase